MYQTNVNPLVKEVLTFVVTLKILLRYGTSKTQILNILTTAAFRFRSNKVIAYKNLLHIVLVYKVSLQ